MAYSDNIGVAGLSRRLAERDGRLYLRIDGFDQPLPVSEDDVAIAMSELEHRGSQARILSVVGGLAAMLACFVCIFRSIPLWSSLPYVLGYWFVSFVGFALYLRPPFRRLAQRAVADYCQANGIIQPTIWSEIIVVLRERRGEIVLIGALLLVGMIRTLFFE